jgi:hypothetical protein
LLAQYRTGRYRILLVKAVRTSGVLVATGATETLLASLASTIEQQQKSAMIKKTRKQHNIGSDNQPDNHYEASHSTPQSPSISDDFNRWYSTYVAHGKHQLDERGDELLDEISILLEQVSVRRRDGISS